MFEKDAVDFNRQRTILANNKYNKNDIYIQIVITK